MNEGRIVIAGAAETNALGRLPNMSAMDLNIEAARNTLAEAGLVATEIDGIASTGADPIAVAHALGIVPNYTDSTMVGGCSPLVHVRHATAAIRHGLCDVVLITHGESGRSRIGNRYPPVEPHSDRGQFEAPYGAFDALSTFPIGVLRYMKETGLTHEQLAMVAVVQRQWSALNPRALMRELVTVDDVLSSRMISYPMRLLQCCLVADGGGALIVTSEARARDMDLRHPCVAIIGTGESAEAPIISAMEDFTTSRAFRTSGQLAFAEAQITTADVDHVMLYDAFAHLPIYALEDLGFVGRGEAGAFIADGNTAPGGALPVNTNGGGLSYVHTGMYGMFAIQESVRQLRGIAPAQVPEVEIAVTHGVGGYFVAAATLVLSRA